MMTTILTRTRSVEIYIMIHFHISSTVGPRLISGCVQPAETSVSGDGKMDSRGKNKVYTDKNGHHYIFLTNKNTLIQNMPTNGKGVRGVRPRPFGSLQLTEGLVTVIRISASSALLR